MQSFPSRARGQLALLCLFAVAGCGDPTPVTPDAAVPPDSSAPSDGGRMDGGGDTTAPTVTSTRPRDEDELVPTGRELEVRFSEVMSEEAGTVSAEVGGAAVALDAATWSAEGDVVRLMPSAGWPSGARVDVTVSAFADAAGNVMVGEHTFGFTTTDEGAPSVLTSTPAEGATDVDTALTTLSITFSEAMNPFTGTVRLEGGAGVIGAITWTSATEASIEVSGLRPALAYRAVLEGFLDVEGNALDGAPVLIDAAIDFTTAIDTTAPTLVDSNPTNGQIDIDVVVLRTITLELSEPMDTSVRNLQLSDGTATQTLIGNWSPDARTLRFDVSGRLTVDATHTLDVSSLRDESGNAIDGAVMLDAGMLGFTTSASDEAVPFVVFTSPVEAATGVSTRTATVELIFSEAMDTSVTAFELADASGTRTLDGAWNAAGTRLTFALDPALSPTTEYSIDVSGTADASGNALDAMHPYLGDGVLTFTTGAPSGEDCADPLTTAEARADGSAWVWTLEARSLVSVDGRSGTTQLALPCAATSGVVDGVIAFEKTTGDLASGGRALRITATSHDDFNDVQIDVFRDVCDPEAPGGGDAAREICLGPRHQWVQYVDAPAGTYYVWVSNENTGDFDGATIRIEEVDAVPEGEGCEAPYDATSAIHSRVGDTDVWTIPGTDLRSVDYGTTTDGEGAICGEEHGADAVVEIAKTSATSILDVQVEPFPFDTILDRDGVWVEARDTCDSTMGSSLECPGRFAGGRTGSLQLTGPAGDYYLWVGANDPRVPLPRTEVRVTEVFPSPGETCGTGIPITPMTSIPVSPDATSRYFAPSCVDGDVTWYRYTTTHELQLVNTTGAAPIALVDAATGGELGCSDDLSGYSLPRRVPVGTEVCIALPSGSPITALSIRELDWRGISGAATDLAIARPTDDSGNPLSITSDAWMDITSSQIVMGINVTSTTTAALVIAPRAGMDNSTRLLAERYSIGNGGVAVGDAIFSIDDTNSTTRPNRLFRLIRPDGSLDLPAGTAWDSGSSYPAQDIDVLALVAGTSTFVMATDGTTTVPTRFYSAEGGAPGAILPLGENAGLRDVVAIAANASWIFVVGATDAGGRTVHRLSRSDLTAAPEPLAPSAELSFSSTNGGMEYDPVTDTLYFRASSAVHAIWDASGATPVWAGEVSPLGNSADYAMAFDASVPALVIFETESVSTGTFTELR